MRRKECRGTERRDVGMRREGADIGGRYETRRNAGSLEKDKRGNNEEEGM